MKARIKKLIKEYEARIEACRELVKSDLLAVEELQKEAKKEFTKLVLMNLSDDIDAHLKNIAVNQSKEMILVQARTDFESLLNYL